MNMFRFKLVAVAILIATFIIPCNGIAKARVNVISVPDPIGSDYDLANIQAAIDMANDGDIIKLSSGTYILHGEDPGTDVEIFTPGGSFSFRDSVISWFVYDPYDHIQTGAWLDTRGKQITIKGAVDSEGNPETIITSSDPLKTNFILVHTKSAAIKDVSFQDSVAGIFAFSPVQLKNVDFINVFYPVSAYVDVRFAHRNWDPVHSPSDFSETVPVVWEDVNYIGACGQSHVSMSAWHIRNSTFYTQQNPDWGDYWFYSSIYTGAFGYLFSVLPAYFGGANVPEDVLALSVFRDFEVIDSTFISHGTFSDLDITIWETTTDIPRYLGNIMIKENQFLDTDGTGLSIWVHDDGEFTSALVEDILIKENIFINVDEPMVFDQVPADSVLEKENTIY